MLRKGSAFAFVLTIAFAAMRMAPPSPAGPYHLSDQGKAPKLFYAPPPPPAAPNFVGGCSAFSPELVSHPFPYDENRGAAKKVLDTFFASPTPNSISNPMPPDVRYAIVLAPDPHHTNLSTLFDREISILLQAAQDGGYDYNSSWLPWQNHERQSFIQLGDQQRASDLTDQREACPGIILFRQRPDPQHNQTAKHSYENALLVFVVGEEATGGINEEQWSNAIQWLTTYKTDKVSKEGVLRVLGPTFTGSLVSLDRDLSDLYAQNAKNKDEFRKKFPDSWIFSGTVTGCSAIHWFQNMLPPVTGDNHIYFGSFQENDAVHISRFLAYLGRTEGILPKDTAILSEDETAYGTLNLEPGDPCDITGQGDDRPIQLSYPRDISALRDAYQKQAIFETSESGQQNHGHPILRDVLGDTGPALDITDTVPSFSGGFSAVDQEAYLYGLVSFLGTHHIRVLLLRCTNPLDFLFLTRFFSRAYPEARIVTVGSDLLFRREIDTTEFRGVLTLSSYSLIPRNHHWSTVTEDAWEKKAHNHVVFEGHLVEGTYIAARYLLLDTMLPGEDPEASLTPLILQQPSGTPLTMRRSLLTEDYSEPYWTAAHSRVSLPVNSPTWLAVVGRDGYWPVAALNGNVDDNSTMVRLIAPSGAYYDRNNQPVRLPLPWLVGTLFALALVCYQLWGVYRFWGNPSDGVLSVFYIARSLRQSWLLGMSCAIAMMLLLEQTVLFKIPAHLTFDLLPGCALYLSVFLFAAMCAGLIYRFKNDGYEFGFMAAASFIFCLELLLSLYWYGFWPDPLGSNDVHLFYRAAHLTDGVSPLVPILLITLGFYLWNWQVMAGHLMLVRGCPTLPKVALLGESEYWISDSLGERIRWIASPLRFPLRILLPPLFLVLGVALCFLPQNNLPLLSLESQAFSRAVNLLLTGGLALTLAEAIRLYSTWIRLKKLLSALGLLRLRRTFANLRALEGKSVWSVSGSVRRVQYELFIKQLVAANQLVALTSPPAGALQQLLLYGERLRRSAQGARWDLPGSLDGLEPDMRDVLSEAVAEVYRSLRDYWQKETTSLNLSTIDREADDKDAAATCLPLSEDTAVQRAEEFVAYHYIAFIQNITARLRTMTLSMICLFITVCFAISFYPFVPRTEVAIWLVFNLVLIGSAVAYVYAGMERDAVLSYITNTQPGRLGAEFWLKLAGFLVGPVIGILATQFPSMSDTVLRWLQPGLDVIK